MDGDTVLLAMDENARIIGRAAASAMAEIHDVPLTTLLERLANNGECYAGNSEVLLFAEASK